MRFILILIGFLIPMSDPVFAQDIFADFERGTWGYSGSQDSSCRSSPHTIRFSPDRTHAEFVWPVPITNYLHEQSSSADYSVISHDSGGIVMAMYGEQRRTPEGDLVVWVLKMLPKNMYCWGRTDWPSTGCVAIHIRCPELPPIS